MFNLVQNYQVNTLLLNEIPTKLMLPWDSFSREEFKSTVNKCNNLLASGSNKNLWKHLKLVVEDNECLKNIINITNIYTDLGYWPTHFKISLFITIPKLNKATYDSLKLFYPIILLNILEKLIEKVIGKKLQFYLIANNFIYFNQLSRLKQQSTTDTRVHFTYIICSE